MKKISTCMFYFCSIAFWLLLTGLPVTAQQMSAEEAVAIALKNNHDIRIARNNAEIAANNRGLGRAFFLPGFDGTAGWQNSDVEETSNSPFSFGDSETQQKSAQLALNWTVFDGFAMFAEKGRYDALSGLGKANARLAIENTVVGVLGAYFDLIRQLKLTTVAENALNVSRDRLEKAAVRREIGGASSTDFLNAQVAYNADRASFLQQQQQLRSATIALNVLLDREPQQALEVDTSLVVPGIQQDFATLLQLVMENSSSVVVAEQNLEVARKNAASRRSSFLPRLALNASQAWSDADQTVSGGSGGNREITSERSTATIGLNLSMNFFNGFRDNIARQNAIIERRNASETLQRTRRNIEGQLRRLYDEFQTSLQLVELQTQSVLAARQNLQLQQERYQLGATGSLEFRDAQVALIRAQSSLISARYQARLLRLQIDQLSGTLNINVEVD